MRHVALKERPVTELFWIVDSSNYELNFQTSSKLISEYSKVSRALANHRADLTFWPNETAW